MILHRIDDKEEAEEYGIETFPAMVYFDKVTQIRPSFHCSILFARGSQTCILGSWTPLTSWSGWQSRRREVTLRPSPMRFLLCWSGDDDDDDDDDDDEDGDDDDNRADGGKSHWSCLRRDSCNAHQVMMTMMLTMMTMTEQVEESHRDENDSNGDQFITKFCDRKHDDITVFFYDSAVKQERSAMCALNI